MVAMLAVKLFAWAFLVLAVGVPIYLFATKPRQRYRRSPRRKRQRMVISALAVVPILLVLLVIMLLMGDVFSELVVGQRF